MTAKTRPPAFFLACAAASAFFLATALPGLAAEAAISLFNGKDLSEWREAGEW